MTRGDDPARRVRWWRWLPLWLALGLVMFAPLGWALRLAAGDEAGRSGFSAAAVSGTIWSGRIDGARVGGLLLGDHHAALAPGALLSGRLGLDLVARHADPARPGLTGRVEAGRGGYATRGLSGRVAPDPGLARYGVTAIQLVGVDALVTRAGCQAASGQISVRIAWPAVRLTGPLTCRAGLLHARLAPTGPVAEALPGLALPALDVTLAPGGRLRASLAPPAR